MNERIELVSDREILLREREHLDVFTRIHINDSGLLCFGDPMILDAGGSDALLEIVHCLTDTHDFRALSSSSPVPFVGKRMRENSYRDGPHECTVLYRYDGGWTALMPSSCIISPADLLPLAPEPPKMKYRAMTPVEAVGHLGRVVKGPVANRCTIHSVTSDGVMANCWPLSYKTLALEYTWADTNEPCGTPLDAQNTVRAAAPLAREQK